MSHRQKQTDFFPILLIAILLLANSVLLYRIKASESPIIDYFTAWSVPKTLSVTKIANVYEHDGQKEMGDMIRKESESAGVSQYQKQATETVMKLYEGRVDATGTPFIYALIGLSASGDYAKDRVNYILFCFISLMASLLIMCYLLGFSPVMTALIITFFLSSYAPIISDVKIGNVNQIQLLIITIFIWLTTKYENKSAVIAAAFFLGIGAMLKPTTSAVCLLSLLSPLLRKEYKILILRILGIGIGAAIAFLISVSYFSKAEMWVQFFKSLPKTLNFSYPLVHGNFSLTKLIFDASGKNMSLVILIVIIAVFSYAVRTAKDTDWKSAQGFVITGIGCAIMLSSSGLVWVHYYILLIPLLLFMMRPASEYRRAGWCYASAFFSMLMLSRVCDFLNISLYIQSLMINISTVILTFSALYEMYIRRPDAIRIRRRT